MAEQQKQSLCPRLIDYLAIVGARSSTVQRGGGGSNQPPVQVSLILLEFSLFAISYQNDEDKLRLNCV